MRAMQSRPYCLTNWTMVNVQLVVQRYATKIRIDALWGVVMSWKTGNQEWTTEGNGENSPSRHVKGSMRRERRNIKTKVRKREEIVNEESFFGGKVGISITCVTVVSGEGVYLLILFLHIFIWDLRMLSDIIIIIIIIMTIFQYKYKNNDNNVLYPRSSHPKDVLQRGPAKWK